jgi:carboxyl-terminal processing protease
VQEINPTTLVYGAAAGIIGTLDPFSQFLTPDAHREIKTGTAGHFGGLGIRIAIREGWLVIITPLPDTPAYRKGILPGDKIIKINGQNAQGISIHDAVEKLRGKPGTKVTITIFREGDKAPRDYTLVREIIKIQSVRSRMLPDAIGYIRLNEFIEPSAPDLLRELKVLEKDGMTSLILDLRNNPGGLLTSAVDVTSLFLGNSKLIVYTEGRSNPRQDFLSFDEKAPYQDLPLAVLVNRGSASGSEIVAGAFQDHKRAVLVGAETFGKGSVQSIIPMDDGSALRLTTAKYYTPAGRSIHRDDGNGKGGITPDIVIEVTKEVESKVQAQFEEVYAKDKKPESTVEEESRITDDILERATQILKAQRVFQKRES